MTDWHGVPVPPKTPGSAEWYKSYSASKVAAILGLSVYDSPYSMWAKMCGEVDPSSEQSGAATRGTYLEPAIHKWFCDTHPDLLVLDGDSYAHPADPLFTASPDGLVVNEDGEPYAILEIKTAARGDEWGSDGTADIPPGYLVQVAWQMFVTGARHCYVAALVTMNLRLFQVTLEDVEPFTAGMVQRVAEFRTLVQEGTPPDWDGHDKTYEAVRESHPDIVDEEVVCSTEFAQQVWAMRAEEERARAGMKQIKSEIAGLMGQARVLTDEDGNLVARRQARGGSAPWVVIPEPR